MHDYQKKRLKRLAPFIIGFLLALSTIIKPIMILFILPIGIMLYKRELKKNKLLALFLIGFFIVFIPFMCIKKVSLNEQVLTIYNLLKNEIIDTNIESRDVIEKSEILENFEEDNGFALEIKDDLAEMKITNKDSHEGKRSLQLSVKTPIKNEIFLKKRIDPSDWNKYNYLNLWIKNKGKLEWFGIILVDEDGDWWHYDNDQILKKQEWTLLKIPLASLKNYEWTMHGNRKMDKIIEYKLKLGPYPKESYYELFIDDIYLSRF